MEKMKASLNAEVPADAPNVADVMAIVAPGKDHHKVLAMGSSRTFGLDAAARETSYGLPYEPVNLGAGSVYKIFTTATAMEKGMGINYVMPVPPSGYASPIYVDGSGRPIPVNNAGTYPDRLSVTDALAQSPNTAFIKLEEFTGVPDVVDMAVRLGMKSLATTPFVDPNTGRRTDRSIAEVTKAQKQASFTLGVTPTSVLELANVGATLASGGTWCPPGADRVDHRPERAARPADRGAVRPGRRARPGRHPADGAEQGRPARRHRRRRRPPRVGWNRPVAGKTGHHPGAQVRGVPRDRAAAVRCGDHLRQLHLAPAAVRRRGGAPYPCGSGNIFGGKTPARTWYGAMKPLLDPRRWSRCPRPIRATSRAAPSRRCPTSSAAADDARSILEEAGLEGQHPHRRQPRRQGHRGRAVPERHRPARRRRSCSRSAAATCPRRRRRPATGRRDGEP